MPWFWNPRWLVVLMAWQIFPGACSGVQSVGLRETAEVQQSTIALSDLLPPEASSATRKASAEVVLGWSPRPGTTRVIEAADIAHALASRADLLRRLAVPDRILVRRAGFPVGRGAVLNAIRRFFEERNSPVDLGNARIEWDEEITTLAANAALRVTHAAWDPPRQTLRLSMHAIDSALGPDFLVQLHSSNPLPGLPAQSSNLVSKPLATETGHPLIGAGTRAWLTLEGKEMRLQIEVVCLQRGTLGQQIRVLSTGTHRVFQAEVTGPRTLRARLES